MALMLDSLPTVTAYSCFAGSNDSDIQLGGPLRPRMIWGLPNIGGGGNGYTLRTWLCAVAISVQVSPPPARPSGGRESTERAGENDRPAADRVGACRMLSGSSLRAQGGGGRVRTRPALRPLPLLAAGFPEEEPPLLVPGAGRGSDGAAPSVRSPAPPSVPPPSPQPTQLRRRRRQSHAAVTSLCRAD